MSSSPTVLAALLLVSAAVEAPGQQMVLPESHAKVSGTGSTSVPFGRSTAVRMQTVYDASLFPAHPVTIRSLAMRIDNGAMPRGKRVEMQVRMSSLGRSVIAVQSAFDRNRGADEQVVFARQLVELPALRGPAGVATFPLRLELTTPFPYDPRRGALVCEFVVFGQQPGDYPLDTTFTCSSPAESFGPAGCGSSGRPLRLESLNASLSWGQTLNLRVGNAPVGAMTGLILGSRETGSWQGAPLPIALDSIGAPGCSLSIDAVAIHNLPANSFGQADYRFWVPSMPALKGTTLRFQALALDAGANALGVTVSQAQRQRICGWEPVARVYAAGLTATEGLRQIGVAPVVRLGYR